MLRRWRIYFRETVRPATTISVIALVVVGTTCMFQALLARQALTLTITIVPTTVVYFFLLLYWRVTDEFKDYETDIRYFPDRPVPSGRVRLSDLYVLRWIGCIMIFATAIFSNLPLMLLILIFFYEVVQGRWFFAKTQIAGNRLLAFATHAPSAIMFNGYVIAVYCNQFGISPLRMQTLVTAVWFSLPFLAHEFARKTRAPSEEEEGYQTYSAMIGFRGSAIVCTAIVAMHWILLLASAGRMHVSNVLLVFTGLIAIGYLIVFASFAAQPEGRSKLLAPATEIYLLLSLLGTTTDLALSHGLRWG